MQRRDHLQEFGTSCNHEDDIEAGAPEAKER